MQPIPQSLSWLTYAKNSNIWYITINGETNNTYRISVWNTLENNLLDDQKGDKILCSY